VTANLPPMALDCACGILAIQRCERCEQPVCRTHSDGAICTQCRAARDALHQEHGQRYYAEVKQERERLIARGATALNEWAAKSSTIEVIMRTIVTLSYEKPKTRRYGEGKLMYREPGDNETSATAVVQLADGLFVSGTSNGSASIEVAGKIGKLGGLKLLPSQYVAADKVLDKLSRRLAEQHALEIVGPYPD
jgi:hypothetical protein